MQMNLFKDQPKLDTREAPAGYYAVLKKDAKPKDGSNICRACDWRPTCQDKRTDLTLHNHRCMDYTVISPVDRREIYRHDGCSVLFKQISDHT